MIALEAARQRNVFGYSLCSAMKRLVAAKNVVAGATESSELSIPASRQPMFSLAKAKPPQQAFKLSGSY